MRMFVAALLVVSATGCGALVQPLVRTSKARGVTVDYVRDRRTNWDDGRGEAGTLITLHVINNSTGAVKIKFGEIELKRTDGRQSITGAAWGKRSVRELPPGEEFEIGVVFDQRLEPDEKAEIDLSTAITTTDGAALGLPALVVRGR